VVGGLGAQLGAERAAEHHAPGVGGGLGVVHDEQAGGAVAGGFLVFVGPAAVVGHGPALEQGGILAGVAGVVDEHHHGFAFHVEAGVVVPAVLGRYHAVAGEYQRGVLHGYRGLLALAEYYVISFIIQVQLLAFARNLHRWGGRDGDFRHRHRLEITAVHSGWLQAQVLKLRRQIVGNALFPRREWLAAQHFI
jgi:hypothetical protein